MDRQILMIGSAHMKVVPNCSLPRTFALFAWLTLMALAPLSGCSGCKNNPTDPDAVVTDAKPDATTVSEVVCEEMSILPAGVCQVTPGDGRKLLKGNVLAPATLFKGGQVAVDATGVISCVGCNCAQGGETVISCPTGVISPGLINAHDHITFSQNSPYNDTGERYEQRHDWRRGQRGHTKISSAGSASGDAVSWAELRFVFSGATSTVGSGGAAGLLRNLDRANQLEGLGIKPVRYETFPLDDSSGAQRSSDCNYGAMPDTPAKIANDDAYEPHVSEGIGSQRIFVPEFCQLRHHDSRCFEQCHASQDRYDSWHWFNAKRIWNHGASWYRVDLVTAI
jgi:hypothetical protein